MESFQPVKVRNCLKIYSINFWSLDLNSTQVKCWNSIICLARTSGLCIILGHSIRYILLSVLESNHFCSKIHCCPQRFVSHKTIFGTYYQSTVSKLNLETFVNACPSLFLYRSLNTLGLCSVLSSHCSRTQTDGMLGASGLMKAKWIAYKRWWDCQNKYIIFVIDTLPSTPEHIQAGYIWLPVEIRFRPTSVF